MSTSYICRFTVVVWCWNVVYILCTELSSLNCISRFSHGPILYLGLCFLSRLVTPLSLQVSRILYSFATAFRRSARKALLLSQQVAPLTPDSDLFTFTVSLEIREDDGKGTFRWDTTFFTLCTVF